jgi:hypothetical protein
VYVKHRVTFSISSFLQSHRNLCVTLRYAASAAHYSVNSIYPRFLNFETIGNFSETVAPVVRPFLICRKRWQRLGGTSLTERTASTVALNSDAQIYPVVPCSCVAVCRRTQFRRGRVHLPGLEAS